MSGNVEFGRLIRSLRQEKQKTDPSYSLRRFAEKVGLSPTFVSKMETGDFAPPSAEKIKRIAELLDYNTDKLLRMANKLDTEFKEIIHEKKAMADFLRTASGFSEEELRSMTEELKEKKKQRKDDA